MFHLGSKDGEKYSLKLSVASGVGVKRSILQIKIFFSAVLLLTDCKAVNLLCADK